MTVKDGATADQNTNYWLPITDELVWGRYPSILHILFNFPKHLKVPDAINSQKQSEQKKLTQWHYFLTTRTYTHFNRTW